MLDDRLFLGCSRRMVAPLKAPTRSDRSCPTPYQTGATAASYLKDSATGREIMCELLEACDSRRPSVMPSI